MSDCTFFFWFLNLSQSLFSLDVFALSYSLSLFLICLLISVVIQGAVCLLEDNIFDGICLSIDVTIPVLNSVHMLLMLLLLFPEYLVQ